MARVAVSELSVGAVLARPAWDGSGRVILLAGTVLDQTRIEMLRKANVSAVQIKDDVAPAAAPSVPTAGSNRPASGPPPGAVYLSVAEVRTGFTVAEPVHDSDGRVLLKVGTPLSERQREMLVKRGVAGLYAVEARGGGTSTPATRAETPVRATAETRSEPQRAEPPSRFTAPARPTRPGDRAAPTRAPEIEYAGIETERMKRVVRVLQVTFDDLGKAASELPAEQISLAGSQIASCGQLVVSEVMTSWRRPFALLPVAETEPYRVLHPVRTAILAVRIGAALSLRDVDLAKLAVAALLQDVGMQLLPSELFEHRRSLTPEERAEVSRHPRIGGLLLNRSGFEELTCRAVLDHHEQWSGSGYPSGRKGADINRLGHILCLAASFMSAISDRHYRKGYLPHEAYEYLTAYSGEYFDPRLVQLMLRSIPPYANGTIVILDGDVRATVVDQQSTQPGRPVVRTTTGDEINLSAPGNLHRQIVGLEPHAGPLGERLTQPV